MARGSRKRPQSYELTNVAEEVSLNYHQPSPSNTSFNYLEAVSSQYATSLAYDLTLTLSPGPHMLLLICSKLEPRLLV